jgi:hypothetical protein
MPFDELTFDVDAVGPEGSGCAGVMTKHRAT